jgi:hypothetical protein
LFSLSVIGGAAQRLPLINLVERLLQSIAHQPLRITAE